MIAVRRAYLCRMAKLTWHGLTKRCTSYSGGEEFPEFDNGSISYVEDTVDGIRSKYSGTPTAIQKVEDILKGIFPLRM
jgi:hypothetical protein